VVGEYYNIYINNKKQTWSQNNASKCIVWAFSFEFCRGWWCEGAGTAMWWVNIIYKYIILKNIPEAQTMRWDVSFGLFSGSSSFHISSWNLSWWVVVWAGGAQVACTFVNNASVLPMNPVCIMPITFNNGVVIDCQWIWVAIVIHC